MQHLSVSADVDGAIEAGRTVGLIGSTLPGIRNWKTY
jgi:hypothetical protein